MKLQGCCQPDFEVVKNAFESNFDQGLEIGASACVTLQGRPVVDLWAGDAAVGGPAWQEDTIVTVYSATKTMSAMVILVLADRGLIDLLAPVASYWPEFAQNGKAELRVADVMNHCAGLPAFDPQLSRLEDLYDWDFCVQNLAAQKPWWQPGIQSGYHAFTQGYIQGEIVRRITGSSIGEFFRNEIANPLGADFHIGLPAEHAERVGSLVRPEGTRDGAEDALQELMMSLTEEHQNMIMRMMGPELTTHSVDVLKTPAWQGAEIPSVNGCGNARSIARVHSALACGGTVDGVSILSSEGVERVFQSQSRGFDLFALANCVWGMGFVVNDFDVDAKPATHGAPIGPNRRAFYGAGSGGSLALIDLDAQVSIAYVPNLLDGNRELEMQRGCAIAEAVYQCL